MTLCQASVTERARAVLIQENTMEPPGGSQTPDTEPRGPCLGNGGRVSRAWSTSPPGHRVMREGSRRKYAEGRGVSSDGLERCRKILHGLGEGHMLRTGERREPDAGAGHEV